MGAIAVLGARMEMPSPLESPAVPLTSTTLLDWIGGGARTAAGPSVTERSSLGMPAVWRAVNLIAGTVAALPLKAYRKGDESRSPMRTGLAAELLADPHPDLTDYELLELVLAHMLLWGNAYLLKLRDGLGVVRELWPIEPWRVRVGRMDNGFGPKVYELDGAEPHTDATVLHLPAFGYDGICGVSPIRTARQGVGLALAAEEYGARLFGNGSLASGILQTEQRLRQGDAERLADRWRAKYGGLRGAHETIVLDSGAKFEQLTIPPGDAQFIESRRFQIAEIARMFGIPPHLLADTEKSTSWGTGIEQQTLAWVKYTLGPWLTRIERRLTKHLLGPSTVYASFNVEGLLRGDSAARSSFYTALWNLGVLSTNDIRALEDMSPVDGGDARYRPLNFGKLGEFDTGTAAPADDDKEALADA